ncbi:hypothetical protein DFH09DRAFT_1086454 [Mycena vulgaris]|nr:hypothetical protein DFH09DRAFT_1086454 [Mycena vulgaris]
MCIPSCTNLHVQPSFFDALSAPKIFCVDVRILRQGVSRPWPPRTGNRRGSISTETTCMLLHIPSRPRDTRSHSAKQKRRRRRARWIQAHRTLSGAVPSPNFPLENRFCDIVRVVPRHDMIHAKHSSTSIERLPPKNPAKGAVSGKESIAAKPRRESPGLEQIIPIARNPFIYREEKQIEAVLDRKIEVNDASNGATLGYVGGDGAETS